MSRNIHGKDIAQEREAAISQLGPSTQPDNSHGGSAWQASSLAGHSGKRTIDQSSDGQAETPTSKRMKSPLDTDDRSKSTNEGWNPVHEKV